jgi:hypothetical protein
MWDGLMTAVVAETFGTGLVLGPIVSKVADRGFARVRR